MRISQCLCFILVGLTCLPTPLCTAAEPKATPPTRQSAISTHMLNTSTGKPAAGVAVSLQRLDDETWETLGRWRTDEQGRVANLSPRDKSMTAGIYRMVFGTKEYFDGQGVSTFYPTVEVVFEIKNPDEHYHVPVLVSPFGYSTYRGS